MQKATFGGGCFWHIQYEFNKVRGVLSTKVGYMGGSFKNPTYEDVCSDTTGHVEVTQIIFDEKVISYKKLLGIFFKMHNPSHLNRQGLDIGTQYRSVIFYHNLTQKKLALDYIKELRKNKKVVTAVEKATKFYKAEEYHQDYLEKKGLKVC